MDRFQGDWSSGPGVPPERLGRLAEAARIQSITASCRLSGIRVSDREVAGALRDPTLPTPDAKAILGCSAALDFSPPVGERLLTSGYLRMLNAVVLGGGAGPDAVAPSRWRETPAHCEAFDADGRALGRVIPILPPRLIAEKLEDLLTWYELELHSGGRHPVPVLAAFCLGLMAISPFERANGRTIRALTTHLLTRAGYVYAPYASLEREMEDLREVYYDAFDRSQSGLWAGSADVGPWLDYFTEILDRHRKRIEAKLKLERGGSELSPLQRSILSTVREHGTVDAGLLLKATGANRNTLKDNLRRMVDRGMLEKTGQRRTTRYRLAAEHAAPAVASPERA